MRKVRNCKTDCSFNRHAIEGKSSIVVKFPQVYSNFEPYEASRDNNEKWGDGARRKDDGIHDNRSRRQ